MQDAKQNRLGTAVDHMHFMTSWIVISTIVQLLFVTCILCIKWIFKKMLISKQENRDRKKATE